MCLYPKLIRNRKYVANKKNGGVIPTVHDERTLHVPVGCGNCMECRKQKARGWQVRLLEDLKQHKNGKFITLTFSNESYKNLYDEIPKTRTTTRPNAEGQWRTKELEISGYESDNEIATLATRRFLERHRKKYGVSLRHWLVTELGHNGTENIHLHGIIWTDQPLAEIEQLWNYGYVWKGQMKYGKLINYVNEQTVNYIVKYIHKLDEKHKTYKPRILTSAGIGRIYTQQKAGDWTKNKFKQSETNETYRTRTGHKIALPIYYRNKIYNDNEKEQLWLQRLDKKERWVCGERVDISTTDSEYYKILKWHQEQNKRLGYGDNQTWKLTKYENERRQLLQAKRLMPDGYPIEWDLVTVP